MGKELQDRSVGELARLAGGAVLNHSLADPGRYQNGGHANAQAIETEGGGFAIASRLGVAEGITRRDTLGRGDVVGEATVFIKGHDKESVLPLGGGTESLVDTLDEALAHVNWGWGVEGHVRAAFRVDPGKLRKGTGFGVVVELVQRLHMGFVLRGLSCPGIEHGVREEVCGVGVVDPGDACLRELLEDRPLGKGRGQKAVIIPPMAVRSARGQVGAIGVCWPRNGGKPAVKKHKILGHGVEDGDMVGGVVVDDFGGARDIMLVNVIGQHLLGDKAFHQRIVLVARMVSAVDLHVSAADAVVGIVGSHILGDRLSANVGGMRGRDVVGIAVLAIHQAIDVGVVSQTAGEVVEGQVLLDQNNNILDVGLPSGRGRVGRKRTGPPAQQQEHGKHGENGHGESPEEELAGEARRAGGIFAVLHGGFIQSDSRSSSSS